ncbi:hypothetical protein T03_9964 [Trichinella britovi]|uniref:Uncharacterized protein n=1 Tax=Trichinella britovi TaxID=45882 RepID=A0A0V1BAP3_TRIBR|nr:hypothetical protein T03_9964 [Trichinella britovi]
MSSVLMLYSRGKDKRYKRRLNTADLSDKPGMTR